MREHATHYRTRLERGLLGRRQPIDPRRQHGVHGVRHREVGVVPAERPLVPRPDENAVVDEFADELLEEERVAVGPFEHEFTQIVRECCREHLRCGRDGKRIEPQNGAVPFSGAPRRPVIE